MSDLIITNDGKLALTDQELDVMQAMLNAHDRTGFYRCGALNAVKTALLLTLCIFLLVRPAFANPARSSVAESPEKFARTLGNVDVVEPVFVYCWADIHFFQNYESSNCQESLSRINALAKSFSTRPLSPSDRKSLKSFLDETKRIYEDNNHVAK